MRKVASGPHKTVFSRRARYGLAGVIIAGLTVLAGCSGVDSLDRFGLYGNETFDNLSVNYTVTGLKGEYNPGDRGEVTITVELLGDPPYPRQAVAFLNIVTPDEKQVAHEIFRQASVQPMIFRTPKPAFHYTNVLTTTVRFRINANADPGKYYLALQMFPGTNTDPHATNVDRRIGRVGSFPFHIE